jgi:CRISPR-associated protein (TIGR03986 family)
MFSETVNFVPCFYITDQDKIVAIGHTGLFRLPYKFNIKDQVPENLLDTNILDIPTALFGDADNMSSRVFFEDAECIKNLLDISMEEKSPKILGTPNPTTFQHYLEQPYGYKTSKDNLSTWNDKTNIRGYKQYWHRNNNDWHEETVIKDDKMHTSIKPIKPGVEFNGKIRFDNLSPIELGSLLFVINLPENHFHKIGMAKPLGLGSVKIESTVEIIDRTSDNGRYSKLFENDCWFLGKITEDKHTTEESYVKAFEKYILKQINENVSSLWETKRLKELKTMLSWENTKIPNWLEKTRYMQIENKVISDRRKQNEYKDRPVLKTPTETVKQ